MTFVSVSRRAQQDLRDASDYRGLEGRDAVRLLARAFDAVIQRLIEYPESGSPRPELAPDVRVVVLRAFRLLVFYHVRAGQETTQVLVLRVLRQERDVTRDDL